MYSHPSLAERVIQVSSKPLFTTSNRQTGYRGTYRQWENISMQKALKEVEQGMPLRRAAERYGVPKSTLHDRVVGKVVFEASSGPDPFLSREEEEELASFLIGVANIGYPHTRKQVLSLVQQIIESKGINAAITNGWWERFCNRNPKITLKTAVPLSYSPAVATDPDVLNRYFDMLEECLRANDIFNCASRIFNCDEAGLPLNPKCQKVVAEVGAKNPSNVTGNTKTQITVLACTNAAGYAIPPFVIFNRKSLNPELTKGEVPGTLYGLSDSGWMKRDLFYYWLLNHFLLYAPPTRPLMLLLDGHSTHYCPEAIALAAEERIVMFALPPNTTHITQPLDRSCFAPLKVVWREVCHEFCVKNPGRVVTLYEFSYLFSKAWFKALTMENIVAGFRVTGVCPFDRSVACCDDDTFSSFAATSLPQRTGLPYIPLYSPARARSHHKKRSSVHFDSSLIHEETSIHTPCKTSSLGLTSTPRHSIWDSPLSADDTCQLGTVPVRSKTKFFDQPLHPSKSLSTHTKPCGIVMTSQENLARIQMREKEKQEVLLQKEDRKQLRMQKKRELCKAKANKPSGK